MFKLKMLPMVLLATDYATDSGNGTEARKDFNLRLPTKAYTLRCVKCEFGKSAIKEKDGEQTGGHPMLTRTFEIVSPEKVTIKDPEAEGGKREVIIQGLQLTSWLVMTAKTKDFVVKDSEIFGVDLPDDERPNIAAYVGKEVKALLSTKVTPVTDEETGEPIMNDDKPFVRYQHNIQTFLK